MAVVPGRPQPHCDKLMGTVAAQWDLPPACLSWGGDGHARSRRLFSVLLLPQPSSPGAVHIKG